MKKLLLILALAVSLPVMAQQRVMPHDLPMNQFLQYCNQSKQNGGHCMAFYFGVIKTLEFVAPALDGVCPKNFSSKLYAQYFKEHLKKYGGIKPAWFVAMTYQKAAQCTEI